MVKKTSLLLLCVGLITTMREHLFAAKAAPVAKMAAAPAAPAKPVAPAASAKPVAPATSAKPVAPAPTAKAVPAPVTHPAAKVAAPAPHVAPAKPVVHATPAKPVTPVTPAAKTAVQPWAYWGATVQDAKAHLAAHVKLATQTISAIATDINTMVNPQDTLVALGIATKTYSAFNFGAPGSVAALTVDMSKLTTALNNLGGALKTQQAKLPATMQATATTVHGQLYKLILSATHARPVATHAKPVVAHAKAPITHTGPAVAHKK